MAAEMDITGGGPGVVGDYVNAFRAGRALAGEAGARAFAGAAPGNVAAGPGDVARAVAAMSEAQRAVAARRAEGLAAMLSGLRGASGDPAQRLAMARHIAGRNPGLGVSPATIGPADVSDAAIAGRLGEIVALHKALTAQ